MAKAWQRGASAAHESVRHVDWRKRMSDNIAYALLVYTALQIYAITMLESRSEGMSILPYGALVILVVAIIPSCRRLERRWSRLSDAQAIDPALASFFRRDRLWLWVFAIGLPFTIAAVFRGLAIAFS